MLMKKNIYINLLEDIYDIQSKLLRFGINVIYIKIAEDIYNYKIITLIDDTNNMNEHKDKLLDLIKISTCIQREYCKNTYFTNMNINDITNYNIDTIFKKTFYGSSNLKNKLFLFDNYFNNNNKNDDKLMIIILTSSYDDNLNEIFNTVNQKNIYFKIGVLTNDKKIIDKYKILTEKYNFIHLLDICSLIDNKDYINNIFFKFLLKKIDLDIDKNNIVKENYFFNCMKCSLI
jgi:DNA-binding Lrp family transcriptional regulator